MFWVIVIIFIVAGIIYFIANDSADKKRAGERKDALDVKLKKLPNQQSLKKIVGEKGRYAFVLDNVGREIYYINPISTKVISFDQIISVEILEDNTLLSSKSTSRTVGGALIGGALAGGAGMVVGGLSGDSKQKKKVSKVSVKIKIRDYSTPTLLIDCFNAYELTAGNYSEIKSDDTLYGSFYKTELKNAQKISDYISIVIDEVDREEKRPSGNAPQIAMAGGSVADELSKLAKLKTEGILTEEEFLAQKKLLLGSNTSAKGFVENNSVTESKLEASTKKKQICGICGYIMDDEDTPEKCPICKAPSTRFNVVYICGNCGHIMEGEDTPEKCPICKAKLLIQG